MTLKELADAVAEVARLRDESEAADKAVRECTAGSADFQELVRVADVAAERLHAAGCKLPLPEIVDALRMMEKLPRTVDGVAIVPGMSVFTSLCTPPTEHVVNSVATLRIDATCKCHSRTSEYPVSELYSTAAAASAAAGEGKK